jgi:hypothetical protein
MPALHNIQAAFMHDIYTGEQTSAVYLNKIKSSPPERINIYYNNTLLGLTDILAGTYPVLQKIVGEDFFRTIGHHYIEKYSQSTGNRHTYGEEFGAFLGSYQPAAPWPYLSDIAAIEWAYFQATIADDALAVDFNILTNLISEQPNFVLSLHPGVHFVDLCFNALEIWQEHQKNEIETIMLHENPQTILIWRDQGDVVLLKKISMSLQKLLVSCQEDKSFVEAMFQAGDGLQDLQAFQQEFAQVVSLGVFTNMDRYQC